jgi:predicted nuclease with TOPRIM domain
MGALVPFLLVGGAVAAASSGRGKGGGTTAAAVETAPETFDQWSSGKEGAFNDLYGQYKDYFDKGSWGAASEWSDYDPGGVTGDYGDTAGIRYRDEAERKAAYQTAYDAAVNNAMDFDTWSKSELKLMDIIRNPTTLPEAKKAPWSGGPAILPEAKKAPWSGGPAILPEDQDRNESFKFNDLRAGYQNYLQRIYGNAPPGIQAKDYNSLLPGVSSDYGPISGVYFKDEAARNEAERQAYNQAVSNMPDFYTWYNSQGAGTYGNPNSALQEYTKLVEGVVDAAPGSVAQKASSTTYLKDASNIANYYSYLDDIGINTSNMDKTELQQAYGMGQSLEKKNQAIADVQGKLDTAKTQYDDLFGSYNTKLGELADVNQQMKDLQGSFDIVTGDYGGLQDTYDALKTQYGNLQDELGTYASQMDSLQGTYDTLLGDYDTLVGQNKALVGDYGALQTDFEGLQDKYGTLTEQYDAATGELTGLKDQYGNLVGQYDSLTGQYTDLQGAYDLLGGQYAGLQDQFAGLQTDFSGLQTQYGTAMSDLEAQKQAYDAAQSKIQQQYFGKLQDEAAANIAKEQARRQAIIEAGATMPEISVPSISPLDPGSYSAPTTNYALQLQNAAPNLFQPIDLSIPNVDFTSMYAPVPLAPQMTQSAPQMNFTAPFQPYLQAVQQQYGVSTPSAYTGIMGGNRSA